MDWQEIESKLKQKAKTGAFIMILVAHNKEEKEKKWVRLSDVLSELKKLQENYIIIEKKKFKDEIVCGQLSTNAIINDLHEKIEEIIKNFISFKASFIEELLKK